MGRPARKAARIRLFDGPDGDGGAEADRLRASGHEVECGTVDPETLAALRAEPPDAFVINLGRAFTFGRDLAMWLRQAKPTRTVPIVFVDCPSGKRERLERQLPDATFTTHGRIRSAVKRAIQRPPADPIRPDSVFAGYSGTPLPKKLGVKPGAVLALLGAPEDFVDRTLGTLPEGVVIRSDLRKSPDLIVWFAQSRAEVVRRITAVGGKVGRDGVWIAWQKKASGAATDLTQAEVRRIGLANGLVDYKICAIDASWSGLKFARRK